MIDAYRNIINYVYRFTYFKEWDSSMSKGQIEASEAKYFRQYVTDIMSLHDQNLSYFELNLETWRQLWRVTGELLYYAEISTVPKNQTNNLQKCQMYFY